MGDAADRPGFADSAVLAGRGHILFETGFTLAHDGDDRASIRTLTWPQVELHGGLTSWLDASVIWDGLVSANQLGDPQPAHATKYDLSADGKKYTFTLRAGLKWSDGSPRA